MPTPPDIFGINIKGIVGKALSQRVFDFTFIKVVSGTRTTGALTGGTNPTTTNYTVKGFVDTSRKKLMNGTRIQEGDIIVVLIGDSLTSGIVPETDDKVIAEGSTLVIVDSVRDPAGATYDLQCR